MSETTNTTKRRPILGCIADDVTGATDLAINLVQGGMCVVQLLEIPSVDQLSRIDADAVVVGLKTRSIPATDAVQQSTLCLKVLREFGIERYFFKYCSTFDSTSEGNIGPVAEALLDELGETQTIFCPAFPRNGRTVYKGHLFVNDQLLHESGMEHHPLNPMTDANLVRFLGKQCDRKVGLLDIDRLEADGANRLSELEQEGVSFVITDTCNDGHLRTIATAVGDMPLVTGGSGIGRYLPETWRQNGLLMTPEYAPEIPSIRGRSLILAGSCSAATNRQVACMRDKIPCWELNVDELVNDSQSTLTTVTEWARSTAPSAPILIYSSATPESVASIQQRHGADVAAKATEDFFASIAESLVPELGVGRLIVAGGETSGAVVNRLKIEALKIGPEICAGVPWTEAIGDRPLALALKSGNFGSDDFFPRALEMLP